MVFCTQGQKQQYFRLRTRNSGISVSGLEIVVFLHPGTVIVVFLHPGTVIAVFCLYMQEQRYSASTCRNSGILPLCTENSGILPLCTENSGILAKSPFSD